MSFSNLFVGPSSETAAGSVRVRAKYFSVDDVQSIAAAAAAGFNSDVHVELTAVDPNNRQSIGVKSFEWLRGADASEKSFLILTCASQQARSEALIDGGMHFGPGRSQVLFGDDKEMIARMTHAAVSLGRPRFDPRPLKPFRHLVAFVVALAFWVGTTFTFAMPWWINALGFALVAIVGISGAQHFRSARDAQAASDRDSWVGHVVLDVTREQLRLARANSRRDVKVIVVTAVGTIITGVIVWLITGSV